MSTLSQFEKPGHDVFGLFPTKEIIYGENQPELTEVSPKEMADFLYKPGFAEYVAYTETRGITPYIHVQDDEFYNHKLFIARKAFRVDGDPRNLFYDTTLLSELQLRDLSSEGVNRNAENMLKVLNSIGVNNIRNQDTIFSGGLTGAQVAGTVIKAALSRFNRDTSGVLTHGNNSESAFNQVQAINKEKGGVTFLMDLDVSLNFVTSIMARLTQTTVYAVEDHMDAFTRLDSGSHGLLVTRSEG